MDAENILELAESQFNHYRENGYDVQTAKELTGTDVLRVLGMPEKVIEAILNQN